MKSGKKNKKGPVKIPATIRAVCKILEILSPELAARFAVKIFTTPVKFRLPKREYQMDKCSSQDMLLIPELNKKINVYRMGTGHKKALLVHGWSGRGTQMHAIADSLVKNGYSIVSFDAPAHGKSEGNRSEMTQFITCILFLAKTYGPFTCAIGHSLGAMAVLNTIKNRPIVKKAVIIGSGDVITDIMYSFIKQLGMSIATADIMIRIFEKKAGQTINNYSAYIAAQQVTIPVLVFHDKYDMDVNVAAAYNINEHLVHSDLIITEGLGHRKILNDNRVTKRIVDFLK